MTDKDIITALEYCLDNKSCIGSKCPAYNYSANCTVDLMKETLNLINRQKAEIEQLKEERDMAVKDIYCSTKCFICKNMPSDGNMTHCSNYSSCGLAYIHFKWRGENNG